MRQLALILLIVGATCGALAPGAMAAPPVPPLSARYEPQPGDQVTRVRPGVVYLRRVTADPLRINVLLFDLNDPRVRLGVGVPGGWLSGRDRTSAIASEAEALAAINGDLFSTDAGIPQGLTMINGRVLTAPKRRATFAWSRSAGPFIGYFTEQWTWQAEVRAADGARAPITLLNTRCPAEQICLYNEFAHAVPARTGDLKLLLGPSGRILRVVRAERLALKPGQQALQATGKGARWLDEHGVAGRSLRIVIGTEPPLEQFEHAISGGPIMLRDGAFVQDCLCALRDCSATKSPTSKLVCEDFSTEWKLKHYLDVRMPRTAIGFDRARTTLIVAVVDGYQRGYSRGITQRELAELLREFGAATAMELDGGGSSTMVLEGKVRNRPPDTSGERYVANALLFFWDDVGRHTER